MFAYHFTFYSTICYLYLWFILACISLVFTGTHHQPLEAKMVALSARSIKNNH